MTMEQELKRTKKKRVSKAVKKAKNLKTKPVPTEIEETDEPSDTPVKLSIDMVNHKKIRGILNSSSITKEEAQLLSETKVNSSIYENKLDTAKNGRCFLRRDKTLDMLLLTELKDKMGKKLRQKSSPFFKKRQEILKMIDENSVIVVHGEPQTGKTTQIPQYILDEFIQSGNASLCKIVSAQPYKKNVFNAFEIVSNERKAIFGNADGIGYQVRFESINSRKAGSITYCTSGILLKKISNSSFLNQITHLIIDDIQEREMPTDLLLAFMKEVITKRSDLKLILICNTIYSRKISKYFDMCEKINVSGELNPVIDYYLEDILNLINFNYLKISSKDNTLTKFVNNFEKSNNINAFLIISIIKYIYFKFRDGAILILLPSISDLHFLQKKIECNDSLKSCTQVIILLNSEMDNNVEYKSNRQIFLTTNERFVNLNTSDIVYVIDSGKIRVKFCDVITNVETVQYDWISQKTVIQRTNLAGRIKPGICIHLFSQETKQNLYKYPIPKILSSDLEKVILDIKDIGIENTELFLSSCLTCPDIKCIRKTIQNFKFSGILNNEELLTPLGYHVTKLPLKYSVGKMVILGALFSCLKPILTIAAYLSFHSIFNGKDMEIYETKQQFHNSYDSDILLILDLLNEFEKSSKTETEFYAENLIRPNVIKEIDDIIQQLADRLISMKFIHSRKFEDEEYNVNSQNIPLIKALLATALYPNIAVVRNHNSGNIKNMSIETLTKRNVLIHPSSINRGKSNLSTPLLMYRTLLQSKHDFVYDTTFLSPLQVLIFADDVAYCHYRHASEIIVNDSMEIQCATNSAKCIQFVQEQFNDWLEYKLLRPTSIEWGKKSWSTSTLRAVVELLNNEK